MSPKVIIYAVLVNICVWGDKPQFHWAGTVLLGPKKKYPYS
jgi:hypothetical protein